MATCGLSIPHVFCGPLYNQVKYKEKYEKERGKAMLDFETPTYVSAKEAQHMQSQVKQSLFTIGSQSGDFSLHVDSLLKLF